MVVQVVKVVKIHAFEDEFHENDLFTNSSKL